MIIDITGILVRYLNTLIPYLCRYRNLINTYPFTNLCTYYYYLLLIFNWYILERKLNKDIITIDFPFPFLNSGLNFIEYILLNKSNST